MGMACVQQASKQATGTQKQHHIIHDWIQSPSWTSESQRQQEPRDKRPCLTDRHDQTPKKGYCLFQSPCARMPSTNQPTTRKQNQLQHAWTNHTKDETNQGETRRTDQTKPISSGEPVQARQVRRQPKLDDVCYFLMWSLVATQGWSLGVMTTCTCRAEKSCHLTHDVRASKNPESWPTLSSYLNEFRQHMDRSLVVIELQRGTCHL